MASTNKQAQAADTAENSQKPEVVKAETNFTKVKNLTSTFFVQPSTGIRIGAKEVKELKDDGWLENQVKARLMAKG